MRGQLGQLDARVSRVASVVAARLLPRGVGRRALSRASPVPLAVRRVSSAREQLRDAARVAEQFSEPERAEGEGLRAAVVDLGSDGAARERYRLRAQLRAVTPNRRDRLCGLTVHLKPDDNGGNPQIVCEGSPGAWEPTWHGVITCRHIWTCPVCSAKLRAKRLEQIDAAMRKGGGRWQMLTLKFSHRRGMPLKGLLDGLAAALRWVKQGGSMQRLWARKVTASVRATEVTHGANGWHPHAHLLLRTAHWARVERRAFALKWQRAIAKFLGPECLPSLEHGTHWSPPIDASIADERRRGAYLAKLGAEIAGVAKKTHASWAIAERAAAVPSDPGARLLWMEFCEATSGRRMLEADERAVALSKLAIESDADEPKARTIVRTTVTRLQLGSLGYRETQWPWLFSDLFAALRRCRDPSAEIERWLHRTRAGACFGRAWTPPEAVPDTPSLAPR